MEPMAWGVPIDQCPDNIPLLGFVDAEPAKVKVVQGVHNGANVAVQDTVQVEDNYRVAREISHVSNSVGSSNDVARPEEEQEKSVQPKQNATNIGEGSQQNDNLVYNNPTVRMDLQIVGCLWGDAVDSDLEEKEDVQAPSSAEKYLQGQRRSKKNLCNQNRIQLILGKVLSRMTIRFTIIPRYARTYK